MIRRFFVDDDFSDEASEAECFTAVGSAVGVHVPHERFGVFGFNTKVNRDKLQHHFCRSLHPSVHPNKCAKPVTFPGDAKTMASGSASSIKNMTASCSTLPRLHRNQNLENISEVPILQASDEKSTFAILDAGASRCIIGSGVLKKLLDRLPESVRQSVKERPSQIKFRFGNNQTLTSQKRMYFPFWSQAKERVWLGVEVVEGGTPFLFSKRAFKQLGGILDTTKDRCTLSRLQKTIELETNATGLYVMDIAEFCHESSASDFQHESFVGHAHHVKNQVCQDVPIPVFIKHRWQVTKPFFQRSAQKMNIKPFEPPCVNSSTGPSLETKPESSVASSLKHGDPCADDRNVEGCGQCHHADSDTGPSALHEPDRDEADHGRGGDATSTLPPTGVDVSGVGSSPRPASGDHGDAEAPTGRHHRQSFRGRSSARPRRGFILGDQLWQRINRTADHQTKSARWIQSTSVGNCWNSGGAPASSSRGRSINCRTSRASADDAQKDHDARTVDHCSVGTKEDCMGQEAYRQDLLPDSVRRHGLLGVVSSSLCLPATSPAGLCGLLRGSAGTRCSDGPTEPPEQPVLRVTNVGQKLDPDSLKRLKTVD